MLPTFASFFQQLPPALWWGQGSINPITTLPIDNLKKFGRFRRVNTRLSRIRVNRPHQHPKMFRSNQTHGRLSAVHFAVAPALTWINQGGTYFSGQALRNVPFKGLPFRNYQSINSGSAFICLHFFQAQSHYPQISRSGNVLFIRR